MGIELCVSVLLKGSDVDDEEGAFPDFLPVEDALVCYGFIALRVNHQGQGSSINRGFNQGSCSFKVDENCHVQSIYQRFIDLYTV